ncbi:FKBP-type peptidyl-prolyl cis-trans isomerase [Pontibacter roseus]|uniref:FKBP-type peptidyl-prolyl cis-trans isomerase n=1 Tax=Pontibacter roseus TaxID=336989 RepID=UPI00036D51EC|nr:FKBP-type peptidyl-prolyl cis-trans isomerase [Pontibacter roseus]
MNLISKTQHLPGLLAKAMFFFAILASLSACKEQEFENPYYQTPEQMEEQKRTDEKVIRKYFRDNNVDTTAVQRTNSGLYHLTTTPGQGDLIKVGQQVTVHYIGKFVNKVTFDNSYSRANPIVFKVGAIPLEVIQGWDEGMQLMRAGEEAFLFIPSYLAYGYYGKGSIPPNSVLIFEIKVLSAK